MKIPFTGYTHIGKEDAFYQIDEVCEKHGIEMTKVIEENASYWGYEFSLQCELDTETGLVEVVGFDGFQIDKTKKLVKQLVEK